ncbi:MAG: tRNA lysidine(34) synthetase TilS [Chloroflexi bacterium RBG_13_46_14]|nr:MAG: tRNA lysidine(34) synthetase TilS [Chloroflexi bacterium RBG_13_46_14]
MESLELRVLQFIRNNSLLVDTGKLLVAVSGGPDSVCLLLLLMKLRDELGIDLYIAHLNHKLRDKESENDAEYVSKLGQKLALPVTIDKRNVVEYRMKHGGTLEEAAREVRYDFLAETAKSVGADAVAVGHTRDDNIETILMHLIRGTGTRGLRGLQPITRLNSSLGTVKVLRPLLEMDRDETMDFCRANGYEPRIDSSNQSLAPLRNRIRHQLIPLLKDYNRQFGEALLRNARIAGDELDFLDAAAGELWERVVETRKNTVILDKKGFLGLLPALQRHLLRQSIEIISGSLKDIEVRHIELIMDALDLQAGKRITLPEGLLFIVEYDRFLLTRELASLSSLPPLDSEHVLNVPGQTEFPGWRVSADFVSLEKMGDIDNNFIAYFDYDKVGNELTVRPRKTADRFFPLGMSQPKKVGVYMIDVKIPRTWRKRVPVVCSPQQIIWIAGYRIDDRVKVTDDTRQVLRLEFIQDHDF